MWLLILALVATTLGPPIYQLLTFNKPMKQGLDSFIMIVTAGIIVFQVLPETFQSLGIWSIVLAILGTTVPGIIEYLFRAAAEKTHLLTLFLGILGLMIHGVLDGSALKMTPDMGGSLLPIAILMHRIPISLTLWWLIKPDFGTKMAISVLATLLLGTILGYSYSNTLMESLSSNAFAGFQAVVAGTLLHVLYHQPGHSHSHHADKSAHTHNGFELSKGHIAGTILAIIALLLTLQLHALHN